MSWLEQAFVSMWEQSHGFPRFKKPGTMRSFVFPQMISGSIEKNRVKLPVIGWVKFRASREIPGDANLKQVRIVRRASGWYAMLTLQWNVEVPTFLPHGSPLGIDVGISHFAAASNGKLFPNPRPFRKLERKLKLLRQKAVWIFLPLYCRATECIKEGQRVKQPQESTGEGR